MRFQRRIKLAKGLHLNLSKSGIGLSAGPRGFKISAGPSGSFLNMGLPGTGISQRTKLGTATSKSRQASSIDSFVSYGLSINEKGNISVYGEDGEIIADETRLRRIKRLESYKSAVMRIQEQLRAEVENETLSFVEIFKQTPKILAIDHWKRLLETAKCDSYSVQPFEIPAPSEESIRNELLFESILIYRGILFWRNRRRREEYIASHLHERLQSASKEWETKREAHENAETSKQREADIQHRAKYDAYIKDQHRAIEGDPDYITRTISGILNEITLPVEFSVDYQIEGQDLLVDLDLPEIEDVPLSKVNILASGKASVKTKSRKEMQRDYAECVTGMAFFLSGVFFNTSPAIKRIKVSGYTQRNSAKTGRLEDCYIFSVVFDRDLFAQIEMEHIIPFEAIQNFEHRMEITSSFEMKIIEPL